MKKYVLLSLLCYLTTTLSAQTLAPAQGGEYVLEATTCISDSERNEVELRLQENIQRLKNEGILDDEPQKNAIVSFDWPLRKTAGLDFNSYYAISNYVDQDQSAGLLDYDCGMRTYDGHNGIDIFTFPFDWYMYANDLVEVIAAAPGTIIAKNDTEFDQQCDTNNSGIANYVIVQHSDGSRAYYWHMKLGSVTTKNVGQTVAVGEYLGVVASSGYSTGPHLHFEVHDNFGNIIEPYQGGCNSLNTQSWWIAQESYRVPTLNTLLTHNAPPVMGCPAVNETPNISDCIFPGETLYTALYFRDEMSGAVTNLRLKRPDNSIWANWTFNSTNTYSASYWYWTWTLPTGGPYGLWQFEADFNGQTYVREFTYNDGTTSNCACASVDLSISFDGFPNQTSWDIKDAGGNVVASSGGTYSSQAGNSMLNLTPACLTDGCYDLTFYDAVNNGMCPFQSNASSSGTFITPGTLITAGSVVATLGSVITPGLCGNYKLYDANGNLIISAGGDFGSSETTNFCLVNGVTPRIASGTGLTLDHEPKIDASSLTVYPTLTSEFITIHYNDNDDTQINIIDINGRILQQHSYDKNTAPTLTLNISDIPTGINFIQAITANGIVMTKKFIKQ